MKQDIELVKLQELFNDGWSLWFHSGNALFTAGDSNCPYAKEYDPKDGHGFSEVEVKADEYDDLFELVEIAYPKCEEKVVRETYPDSETHQEVEGKIISINGKLIEED